MNVTSRAMAAVFSALAAATLLGACTDKKDVAPAPTTVTISQVPSQEQSTPPVADLSTLTVQQLTGVAPTTLPQWKPGDDAKKYSIDTLLFLVAAAKKAGLTVPPVKYAFYEGDPESILSCSHNPHIQVEAEITRSFTYCGDIDSVLIIPRNWPNFDPWSYGSELHDAIESLSFAFDETQVYELKQYCYVGVLYGSIARQLPALREKLAGKMAPVSGPESAWADRERLRADAYAVIAAGRTRTC